jgi:hypothetical protein
MMLIEELLAEIEKDSKINQSNLESEIVRCTSLMAKYLRYHRQYKDAIVRMWKRKNECERQKQEYYAGRATSDVYRATPFNLVVKNATEMQRWILSDEEYSNMVVTVELIEDSMSKCELMIEQLKFRPNHIATILDIRKFESGA